jgi:hypothetical protein
MNEEHHMETNPTPRPGGIVLIVIAWLLVIIPAAWGVTQTIRQSMVLFTTPPPPATQPA